MSDYSKNRLIANVSVQADDGSRHVFGPDDDVPDWAKEKITNPGAWGYPEAKRRGRRLDYGHQADDYGSDLSKLLEIWCTDGHKRKLIARFEVVPDEWWAHDGSLAKHHWAWTASLAMQPYDTAGQPDQPDGGAEVDQDRRAVVQTPDGRHQVRLFCGQCRSVNLVLNWEKASRRFDQLRAARVSSVELRDLARTIHR